MSGTRGTTAARGYGPEHVRLRKRWAPPVERGEVRCARCGRWIQPGQLWDLDHRDDRQGYLGPSHRSCNRSIGARRAGSGGWDRINRNRKQVTNKYGSWPLRRTYITDRRTTP